MSLLEGSIESQWSSLRYGTIVGGRLYQPKQLEPAISGKDGFSLAALAARGKNLKTLPTLLARDWKGAGGANRNSADLPRTMGGSLNPSWGEDYLGYPIGYTELEPWATAWFLCRPESPSKD